MRKLAREAVIFMLLTPPLLAAGVFLYFHFKAPKGVQRVESPIQTTSRQERSGPQFQPPPGYVPIPENSTPPVPDSDSPSEVALLAGAYFGIPVGIGLWIFYRAARFAVKG